MTAGSSGDGWQVRLVNTRHGLLAQALRPAEVGALLCDVMLARDNWLEDAQYQKIVPNQFVVELSPENYTRNYAPLEKEVCEQWRERLLNNLTTANSRQGRLEYRFAGQVSVAVRRAADLERDALRIRSRLRPDAPDETVTGLLPACLELLSGGQSWDLRAGIVTLGREPGCDIFFDNPRVQELRLISGQHAYLHCLPGSYRLFDGTPQGLPSINGTFVNGYPVVSAGQLLSDGDILILAAVRRDAPSAETPGVVALRFRANCR